MTELSQPQEAVIQRWAWIDLVVTASFALPLVARGFLAVLYEINGLLGGLPQPPPLGPLHEFFLCLAGALGVIWAIARIRLPLRPLGLIDATGRVWVSALIAYFVFAQDAPVVLLLFLTTELGGALHQFMKLRGTSDTARA